ATASGNRQTMQFARARRDRSGFRGGGTPKCGSIRWFAPELVRRLASGSLGPTLPSRGAMNQAALRPLSIAAFVTFLLCLPAAALAQGVLPPGFEQEDAVPGEAFTWPTAMAFIDDERFLVAEQDGIVWIVNHGVRHPAPVIDLTADVLNDLYSDRGLLGLAVDPHFKTNRYVYVMYTADPDSNDVDSENAGFGRLVRYQMSATDSNAIDPSTRTILFGRVWSEGSASGSITHTVGALRFARDGSLLVSIGDGAHYEEMDPGGLDPNLFLAGRTAPSEDIGAF